MSRHWSLQPWQRKPGRPWPLRVWLVSPPEVWVSPGGGEIQLLATARALQKQNLQVYLLGLPEQFALQEEFSIFPGRPEQPAFPLQPNHSSFQAEGYPVSAISKLGWASGSAPPRPDLLHLFGSHPAHWRWVAWARQHRIPVVLSPIGWFSLRSYWLGASHWPARLLRAGKFLCRALCPWWPSWRRRLYQGVDLLLPNSQAEAHQLTRYFSIPARRIHVVPNGADPRFAQARAELFIQKTGLRNFLFCPARLEPRKNQLGLLRAMRGWQGPIVLMGDPSPGHQSYAEACRQQAGPNVHFLPRLAHEDPLLASAYAACGCLVLASWFETPGLAALEAAMQAVPLVLPDVASCREYFGPWALYVRSNDWAQLRQAVEKAFQMGRNPRLAQHVLNHYTWKHTAQATLEAYARLAPCQTQASPPQAPKCTILRRNRPGVSIGSYGFHSEDNHLF